MRTLAKKLSMSAIDLLRPATFTTKFWKQDLSAGIITGIVALPLCLAIAIASGVPPVYGIYTSIIAGILVAIFGGTELGVSGPAAATAVLVFSIVSKFGLEGLLLASVMAGVIQIIMGITGIGRVVKFIPYTVITGFTTGIGVLIIIGQLQNLTAVPVGGTGILANMESFFSNIWQLNIVSLALGLGTLAMVFVIPRISKKIPASTTALLVATLVAALGGLALKTVGDIPSGLPGLHIPAFDPGLAASVFASAVALALLASIETLLSSVALDGMTGTKHSSSKELVGQGIANAVSPFFRGIPATGVIVRSATNVKNGAKSRLSAVIHAVTLLVILLLLGPWAKDIPLTVLAGILIYTAIHLISIEDIQLFLKNSRSDFGIIMVTIGSTVFLDLTTAIFVGFSLAGLVFIKKMSENTHVTIVPESSMPSQQTRLAQDIEGIARTYQISGPLFFASAFELEKISQETPENRTPALVLDLTQVDYMDSTALAILRGTVEDHKKQGEVYLAIKNAKIRRLILDSGVMEEISPENIVSTTEEGLKKARIKYGHR